MSPGSANIIEQAARRLEQLRDAGIEMPWRHGAPPHQPSAQPANDAPPDAATASAPEVQTIGSLDTPAVEQVELKLAQLAAGGYLVPGTAQPALAGEFRVIKRPLVANATASGPQAVARGNLVLVTSALPGEGKTYTAINLALSIASEIDRSVLLVDADVVKPAVSTRLGIEGRAGLLDVLEPGGLQLAQAVLRTNVPKLSVLPSGLPRPHAAELLSSNAMLALLADLAGRYADRVVVIDGPPLLPTTEARILTSLVGQVVMVVEAGRTSAGVVQEAYEAVAACPVVLSVLNKRSSALRNYRYGYGYGY